MQSASGKCCFKETTGGCFRKTVLIRYCAEHKESGVKDQTSSPRLFHRSIVNVDTDHIFDSRQSIHNRLRDLPDNLNDGIGIVSA